ncbi:MAG: acyl--CoA ligase [Deltaproteobacteria bacterium]|nr:acyl--CoA ligase [Deltaproteobacteria bacterium]
MPVPGIEKNLGTLLEKAVAEQGEKMLLHIDPAGMTLSYRQFNDLVNRAANVLTTEGTQQGDHVAVMLPNCQEFPVVWLALAKIGAVMVPVNKGYKAHDLEYVINDSDAKTLIIHSDFKATFQQVEDNTPGIKKVYQVGENSDDWGIELSSLINQASTEFTMTNIPADSLMNIQYTSGTTGFPKGCMLTHEYWMTLALPAAKSIMQADDIFLSVPPFYYMDPQWELIMCLFSRCSMVLADRYSPSNFMRLINKHNITVSWAIVPTWIYKQPESKYDKDHHLRLLRVGSGFPANIHQDFEKRFNVRTREGFGMTEIGGCLSVDLDDDFATGSGTVGKPSPFREVKIVDDDGNSLLQGEIGELWVKGPGMFKGYYKKPEATAEVFNGDWFRTGDLFRVDENGYYYIVGRKKDMIRRSSENISATEVEGVLTSHPSIVSAAVVSVPDVDRGEEVKAFIIPAEGKSPETIPPEEVISYCRERIAEFKVPRYIEYRASFPVTATGKIQKHSLAEDGTHSGKDCFDRLKDK